MSTISDAKNKRLQAKATAIVNRYPKLNAKQRELFNRRLKINSPLNILIRSMMPSGLGENETAELNVNPNLYDFNPESYDESGKGADIKPPISLNEATTKTRFRKDKRLFKTINLTLNIGDVINALDFDEEREYLLIKNTSAANHCHVLMRDLNDVNIVADYPDAMKLIAGGEYEPIRRCPLNAISLHNNSATVQTVVIVYG